jgi:D-arabinose 1-dehydrogenase-like Zn-dependent alcohol dehydrogenase
MRAMAVTAYGEPLTALDLPEPDVPAGYALLEVLACGVCFSDVKTGRGEMPFSPDLSLPHIPGHEICGRVLRTEPRGLLEVGTVGAVYHYWPCGRCRSCSRGDETLCTDLVGWVGFTHPGGFRERIAVPVERLIPVPPSIDPIAAAPMSCALGTAYRAVAVRGGVRAGMSVAIVGLGGVGLHAAQIADAAGARVIGFDRHAGTLEVARDLGLDARPSDIDAIAAGLEEIAPEGVDVVVETVGQPATLDAADRLVRRGGRIVGVGYGPTSHLDLPTPRVVLGELEVLGSRYAHRSDLVRAMALVASGRVTPIVGLVRSLDEVNEVFDALVAGQVVGRAVLDVAGVRTP